MANAANPLDDTPPAGTKTPKQRTLGQKLGRWALILGGVFLLLCLIYRWIGTTTMRGTVQRVYETDSAFKVEFVDESGTVHVAENTTMHFPHLKLETADLQANLHHLSRTHDIVDMSVWGLRLTWFEVFPNVVDVEFIRSNEARKKAQVEAVTESVMRDLVDQGLIERGPKADKARATVTQAVERTLVPSDLDGNPVRNQGK